MYSDLNDHGTVSAFSPLNLNPYVWLDASDISTVTLVSNVVSQWADKSGNARHVSQSTPGNRPAYTSGQCLNFTGGGKFLSGSLVAASAGSWVLVYNANGDSAFTVAGTRNLGGGFEFDRWQGDGKSYPAMFRGARVESYRTVPTSGIQIVTGISNSSTWEEWRDGASGGAAVANYGSPTGITLGNSPSLNTATWFEGLLYDVLLFDYTLNSTQRQQLEGWAAWKNGTQATLPVGHPYKNQAP